MAVVRAQVSWAYDSALPRDALTINPHFNNTGGLFSGENWESFAADFAQAMYVYANSAVQTTVTIYDTAGPAPHFPLGKAVVASGIHPASAAPREVALCLSYYAERNMPRLRGRLYVPISVISAAPGVRPAPTHQTKVGALAQLLQDAGGVDIDWSVWSRRDLAARKVTNWWVDNEWDTVRSRGMRGTARTVGTSGE